MASARIDMLGRVKRARMPRTRSYPSPCGGGISAAARGNHSAQFDVALDLMRKIQAAERHHRLGGEFFVALELALGERGAHRLLDLALGRDAQRLEEFADAVVEDVFIHDRLPLASFRGACEACEPGIHNHGCGEWIPDRRHAASGMTRDSSTII